MIVKGNIKFSCNNIILILFVNYKDGQEYPAIFGLKHIRMDTKFHYPVLKPAGYPKFLGKTGYQKFSIRIQPNTKIQFLSK